MYSMYRCIQAITSHGGNVVGTEMLERNFLGRSTSHGFLLMDARFGWRLGQGILTGRVHTSLPPPL